MKAALLYHGYGGGFGREAQRLVRELATALAAAGHAPAILGSRRGGKRRYDQEGTPVIEVGRLPEAPLRYRGFAGPLTQVPAGVAELLSGGYDVAHAFSPVDALTAHLWRRLTRAPVVFTPGERVGRDVVADRRLRLSLLRRAVEESDAVIAPSDDARSALRKWMAVEAHLVEPVDARGHAALYSHLLGR